MIRSERVTFPGAFGTKLDARLDRPVGPVRATALFAHCFTCSKHIGAAGRISRALAHRGIAVLRFDFTGLGHSEGEFANTNFSSNIEDLVRAADHLRAHEGAPSLLVGHSVGGTAVLAAAERIPEATTVVAIAAPSSAAHVARLFTPKAEEIRREGSAEVAIGGRTFRIRREMLDDLEAHPLGERIGALRKALLVLHAPLDATVGIENATEIFLAARHPKSFVSLDDADHLISQRADAEYAAEVIAAWAGRYLPATSADEGAREPGVVAVEETGEGPYENDVVIGRHRLRADEPQSSGGGDAGPSPYGYLAAALGACTSMTLRMYADRKQWPLEKVSVTVAHAKVHAEDGEHSESRRAKIDRFDRTLRLEGPLTDEQRARLAEIAGRCPVHRTLEGEVQIRTQLAALPTSL